MMEWEENQGTDRHDDTLRCWIWTEAECCQIHGTHSTRWNSPIHLKCITVGKASSTESMMINPKNIHNLMTMSHSAPCMTSYTWLLLFINLQHSDCSTLTADPHARGGGYLMLYSYLETASFFPVLLIGTLLTSKLWIIIFWQCVFYLKGTSISG